jgi:hypothetical protein
MISLRLGVLCVSALRGSYKAQSNAESLLLQTETDNKMKLGLEQVGKGGLPPLLRHVGSKSASGGKPPFPTCSI